MSSEHNAGNQLKPPKLSEWSEKMRQVTHESLMTTNVVTLKDFVDELKEFSLYINSLREIVRAKSKRSRMIWASLGCLCFVVCIICIGILLTQLFEGPTSTKVTYNVNQTLTFPVVTVCTYARINGSKVKQMGISEDLLSYMMSSFKGIYLFYSQGANLQNRAERLENEYQNFLKRTPNFTLVHFFNDAGIQCNDFLGYCSFQGAEFSCCEHVREILSEVGKCFVIQQPKDGQIIPGSIGGLKVYVSNWAQEYPQAFINSNPDMGMQIHITPANLGVYVTSKPVVVFPKTHAMIRLKRTLRKIRQKFDSDGKPTCTKSHKLKYYTHYNVEACFTECMARLMLEQCSCIQIGSVPLENIDQSLLCSPHQSTMCVQPLLQDKNASFLWDLYNIHKECQCPMPCHSWEFETVASYSAVSNPGFSTVWRNPEKSGIKLRSQQYPVDKEEYVVLDIYYDSLIWIDESEVELFPFGSFVSNMGGQLSVWIGIRLLTVVQLLYYLFIFVVFFLPFLIKKFLKKRGFWQLREKNSELGKQLSLYPPNSEPRILTGLSNVMFLGMMNCNSTRQSRPAHTSVTFSDHSMETVTEQRELRLYTAEEQLPRKKIDGDLEEIEIVL